MCSKTSLVAKLAGAFHEYVELDLSLAVEALERLEMVRQFVRRVANLEGAGT